MEGGVVRGDLVPRQGMTHRRAEACGQDGEGKGGRGEGVGCWMRGLIGICGASPLQVDTVKLVTPP
jgi:hypothetical protein